MPAVSLSRPLPLRPALCRGFSSRGWPTAATNALWSKLVEKLGKYPFVWFGVVNEPESNSNGAQDSQVGWWYWASRPVLSLHWQRCKHWEPTRGRLTCWLAEHALGSVGWQVLQTLQGGSCSWTQLALASVPLCLLIALYSPQLKMVYHPQVLAAMNSAVSTIRAKEASLRQPDHIIAVQVPARCPCPSLATAQCAALSTTAATATAACPESEVESTVCTAVCLG